MAHSPAIQINNLTKSYGDKHVLTGLNLDVPTGTVLALLGPNGAGKTTTVEILQGLRRPGSGTVSVLGQDPQSGSRAWRARIGVVSQSSKDMEKLTVTEAITHVARFYSSPADVAATIEQVGLSDDARTRLSRLSGGRRRRLDVGVAIVGRPALLFLDEPTTGFDPEARREFWDLVKNLRSDGTTVLLTTHYLDEAAHLADDVRQRAHRELDRGRRQALRAGCRSDRRRARPHQPPGRPRRRGPRPGGDQPLARGLLPQPGLPPPRRLRAATGPRPSLDSKDSLMTTANPTSPTAPAGAKHPVSTHRSQAPGSSLAAVAALTRSSLISFVREPVAFIMTIFYPLLMLIIFASVFSNDIVPGVSYADYMLPAMISTGTIMSCLLTLAIGVASERESGELKRLAVLPVPTWAYVASKCVYNTILAVVSAVLLLLVGHFALGASLPADGRAWGLFVGGLVLTVAVYTPLGLAAGRLSPSPGAASGALLPAVMVFQFVSGLLLPLSMLPSWMVHGFSVFPVRWSAGLMRQAFLPDFFASTEPTGTWETGKALAVIAAWIVGGVVVAFIVSRRDTVDR